jgi:hypothetical protein
MSGNIMKKLAIALTFAVGVTSAQAWGDREQGALLGLVIGGAIAAQKTEPQRYPYDVYPQQQIIVQPQQQLVCGYNTYCGPTYCYQEPIWGQYGQVIAYRNVCR